MRPRKFFLILLKKSTQLAAESLALQVRIQEMMVWNLDRILVVLNENFLVFPSHIAEPT